MAEGKDQPLDLTNAKDVTIVPMRSLHRKLAQVMYEAERIPKNGTAPKEMGGYRFVEVGDAADFIRKALAEKVITMMPTAVQVVAQHEGTTKAGATIMYVDLITDWTLTDGESGESITIQSFGAGADMGDKYSGKASTSAMKYALLTGFLLSTGEDSERASLPERGHTPLAPLPRADTNGGLIGTLVAQGTQDFQLRQTPDGWTLPFRVKEGNKSQIVVAEDQMAQALDFVREDALNARVTVFGTYTDETLKKGGKDLSYQVLHLTRIVGPTFTIPAPPEAVSLPLFDEDEAAEIIAQELVEAGGGDVHDSAALS